MKGMVTLCFCVLSFFADAKTAPAIELDQRNAVVWLNRQTLTGQLDGFFTDQLLVRQNKRSFKITVRKDSTFSFAVTLQQGENRFRIATVNTAPKMFSDALVLILGFNPEPVVKPYGLLKKSRLTLHLTTLQNPWKGPLHYLWSDDGRNPARCVITNKTDSVAGVALPLKNGVYYFNLRVSTPEDTAHFSTFVVRSDSGVRVFDMDSGHAPWIDTAIIYQITPSAFVRNGSYDDIAAKLDELKSLGINAIWLQPVYKTFRGGQGYDVTDYFSLREDFGTSQQLKRLIEKARALNLKVLFDFVPNHTSIKHPYAQDYIRHGTRSHYYDFYQHEISDGAPYSSFYNKDSLGFVNYFWADLVNLNYSNEEVQRWMIEACKYWIKKFDIDGYRFDAVWGVNARAPLFAKRLRTELKSIKPELLFLAEDKGADANVYKAGFDVAYDWTADTAWVSHWPWQYEYDAKKNLTVFNHPDVTKRAALLQKALFGNGDPALPRLRFMENNDLPRFIKSHNLEATKLAAALLFALPGIPMLYNGQEIGYTAHPYSKHSVFKKDTSIQDLDSNDLFPFYQQLIGLRKKYAALQSSAIAHLPVFPQDKLVAFRRWKDNQAFVIVMNIDSASANATLDAKTISNSQATGGSYVLEDVLTAEMFHSKADSKLEIPLRGYGIRWLLVK